MKIKKIEARSILDSRNEKTIELSIETEKGRFTSSAPSGKSRGRFEAKPYAKSLDSDIEFINNLNKNQKILGKIKIEEFKDLKEIEGLTGNRIGANSLFAFESSILKALAAEQNKQLWEFLSRKKKPVKFPLPVGNAIGGGLHAQEKRKPDFQEFLFLNDGKRFSDAVELNKKAYKITGQLLNAKETGDEGAWKSPLDNEENIEIIEKAKYELEKQGNKIDIGIDAAASTFFKNMRYIYKNIQNKLNKEQQIEYISELAEEHHIFYLEDPLEENDFEGFAEIKNRLRNLIVGDDLTVTNLLRLKKAKSMRAIDAIIVKPNQNGSLLKVKEICDFCEKKNIKTIFSHRSGETSDTIISDLAVAWKADFVKFGIFGKEREAKLKRLIEIERRL